MAMHKYNCIDSLRAAGFAYEDATALRRISMTLNRWFELECGGGNDYASWSIERDETTNKPYLVTHPYSGKSYRRAVPDREKGAEKCLAKILSRYPDFAAYIQSDPRGASLYILRKTSTPQPYEQFYTQGIAVYR